MRLLILFLILGFAVLLHEAGHLAAAKVLGIRTEIFSLGLGPKLLSIKGKNTEYRLSLLPFGGYCRIAEHNVPLWKKLAFYLAGPLLSLLVALFFYGLSALLPVTVISDPAYIAPFSAYPSLLGKNSQQLVMKGDLALSSGQTRFEDYQEMEAFLLRSGGRAVPLTVLRDGKALDIVLESDDGYYGICLLRKAVIGSSSDPAFQEGDVFVSADGQEIEWDMDLYAIENQSFTAQLNRNGQIIERTINTGSLPFAWESGRKEIRRPVRLLSYPESIIELAGLLSLLLSLLNLLPVPVLDGGEALLLLIEIARKKQFSARTKAGLKLSGIIILALLTLVGIRRCYEVGILVDILKGRG